MKLRTGRRNQRTLYLQVGDKPSDDDPCLGLIIDPAAAAVIADAVNRSGHARVTESGFLGPHRVRHAVLGTRPVDGQACCD